MQRSSTTKAEEPFLFSGKADKTTFVLVKNEHELLSF